MDAVEQVAKEWIPREREQWADATSMPAALRHGWTEHAGAARGCTTIEEALAAIDAQMEAVDAAYSASCKANGFPCVHDSGIRPSLRGNSGSGRWSWRARQAGSTICVNRPDGAVITFSRPRGGGWTVDFPRPWATEPRHIEAGYFAARALGCEQYGQAIPPKLHAAWLRSDARGELCG